MLIAIKLKLAAALALVAAPAAVAVLPAGTADNPLKPEIVTVAPKPFTHRVAGEYLRGGRPVNAPLLRETPQDGVAIMAAQVSAGDYRRCVQDGACAPISAELADDMPAVGVNWYDATAYADWLSRRTGEHYRLPSDGEWAFAAGARAKDDGIADGEEGDDFTRRWLAKYAAEAEREQASDKAPRTRGSFGGNEHGLVDVAGNVWEWTQTCYERHSLDDGTRVTNCGVRVVQGAHRAYVTDFVRDAKAGGCAVGVPPSNLGFRLVREQPSWRKALMARIW